MSDPDWDEAQLAAALDELDDSEAAALTELLEESPRLLRRALEEYGYLGPDDGGNGDAFITNEEAVGLSEAQRELSTHLTGRLESPMTVDQIVDEVGSEGAAFRQQYNSAQYRSWMSEQLNALVEAGELGRFRDGRSVYYTETPVLAVRHWVRLNELFVDELSVDDTAEIADDTGMPAMPVREAIRSINDD
jgi:hypothetical protein